MKRQFTSLVCAIGMSVLGVSCSREKVEPPITEEVIASPEQDKSGLICTGIYWGGYCTDYAAQQFNAIAPSNKNWGGHAGSWLANANAAGWQTSTDFRHAEPGAIVVWSGATFGHVAISEGVIQSDNTLNISEKNWGAYRTATNNPTLTTCYYNNAITWNYNVRTTANVRMDSKRAGNTYTFVGYIFPRKKTTNTLQITNVNGINTSMSSQMIDIREAQKFNIVTNMYYRASGTLRLELSNASGQFSTPTVLASVTYNSICPNPQVTLPVTIPSNIPSSTNYKVRARYTFSNNARNEVSILVGLDIFSNVSITKSGRTLTVTNVRNATYTWFRNNVMILGANSPTYTVPTISGFANQYTCRVSRGGLAKNVSIGL